MTCNVYRATMIFTDPNGVKHVFNLSSSTPNPLRRTKIDMFEVNGEYIVEPIEGDAKSIVSRPPSPQLHTIEEEPDEEVVKQTAPLPQPPVLLKATEPNSSRSMSHGFSTLPASEESGSDNEEQAMTDLRKRLRRAAKPRTPRDYYYSDSEDMDEDTLSFWDTPKTKQKRTLSAAARDTVLKRLHKEVLGPDYSSGDESPENTDDEEYAEWLDAPPFGTRRLLDQTFYSLPFRCTNQIIP
ncbi:hypothetical protein CC2G_010951 [Coprinopsis cinerea AmutBmut pab1-1]|nr:hypothetical protein CC2G_010951 [Coprinopsis cinerea AmutBmut pab1-1]